MAFFNETAEFWRQVNAMAPKHGFALCGAITRKMTRNELFERGFFFRIGKSDTEVWRYKAGIRNVNAANFTIRSGDYPKLVLLSDKWSGWDPSNLHEWTDYWNSFPNEEHAVHHSELVANRSRIPPVTDIYEYHNKNLIAAGLEAPISKLKIVTPAIVMMDIQHEDEV